MVEAIEVVTDAEEATIEEAGDVLIGAVMGMEVTAGAVVVCLVCR